MIEDDIAAVRRELQSLDLTKAHRDRRLTLNAKLLELEAAQAKLVKVAELKRTLADVQAQLAATPDDAVNKSKRRELMKQRSQLEADLRDAE